MGEKDLSGECVEESSVNPFCRQKCNENFQIPSVFNKRPASLSLPVIPMKALLATYKNKRVGQSCEKMTDSSDKYKNEMRISIEQDSCNISEDKLQNICDIKCSKEIQTELTNVSISSEIPESRFKRLEVLVADQSEIISNMKKELSEINTWKTDQVRLQAAKIIQNYWRKSKSRSRSDHLMKDKSLTGDNNYFIERFKELNKEVTLLKNVLQNLIEHSIKEGNLPISLPQETYNDTSARLEFITDLRATVQSDSSLLLTWTQYSSAVQPSTAGFSICINGHQVGTVSSEKTKAFLEGLNPNAFYKITLVEQICTSNPRESNPVFICIDRMKPSLTQHSAADNAGNQSCISSEDKHSTECSEQLAVNSNKRGCMSESNDPTKFTAVTHSDRTESIASNDKIISNEPEVILPTEANSNGSYAGEKRELNRTYELEKKLTEIRRQIAIADIETADDDAVGD